MIKAFYPFGSSYLSQAHELFKMEQKNASAPFFVIYKAGREPMPYW
jgi:hypothetical protein